MIDIEIELIEEFKQLEALINDCYSCDGHGVSRYIDEMESTVGGQFSAPSWKDDYYKLKHCRWLRNNILHESNEYYEVTEEDINFLANFRNRIMEQTDPLALVYKRKRKKDESSFSYSASTSHTSRNHSNTKKNDNSTAIIIGAALISTILIVVAILIITGVL